MSNPIANAKGDELLFGGSFDPRVNPIDVPRGAIFIYAPINAAGALLYKTDDGVTANYTEIPNAPVAAGMDTDFGNAVASVVDLDLGGFKIENLGDPVLAQDAATKNYIDTLVADFINKDGSIPMDNNVFLKWRNAADNADVDVISLNAGDGLIIGGAAVNDISVGALGDISFSTDTNINFTGNASVVNFTNYTNINFNTATLSGVADPTLAQDAATKNYVDGLIAGGANTTLSNLASPTAINQHLLPNANSVFDLGSSGLNWRNLYVGNEQISNFARIQSKFELSSVNNYNAQLGLPNPSQSSGAVADPFYFTTGSLNLNFGTRSFSDATNTADVYIFTGDSTGGNSGDLKFGTGTAGVTRGDIDFASRDLEIVADRNVDVTTTTGNMVFTSTAGAIQLLAPAGGIDITSDTNLTITSTNGTVAFVSGAGAINFNNNLLDFCGTILGGNTGTFNIKSVDVDQVAPTENLELSTGTNNTGDSGNLILTTGTSPSGLRGLVQVQSLVFGLPTGTADPSTTYPDGSCFYRTDTNQLRVLNGGTWRGVTLT